MIWDDASREVVHALIGATLAEPEEWSESLRSALCDLDPDWIAPRDRPLAKACLEAIAEGRHPSIVDLTIASGVKPNLWPTIAGFYGSERLPLLRDALATVRKLGRSHRLGELLVKIDAAIKTGSEPAIRAATDALNAEVDRAGSKACTPGRDWWAAAEGELVSLEPVVDGLIDKGNVVVLIGGSKSRKTWLCLQLCAALGAGRPWIGWPVPRPRSFLYCNLEGSVTATNNRIALMARSLAQDVTWVSPSGCERGPGRILDLRGTDDPLSEIVTAARRADPEVIVIDPCYRLLDDDENKSSTWRPLLALAGRWSSEGRTVVLVHHDPKGVASERAQRDRGAGSSILGRSYDVGISIDEHASIDGAMVLSCLCRNRESPPPSVIRFQRHAFWPCPDADPTPKTCASASRPDSDTIRRLMDAARWGIPKPELIDKAVELGMSTRVARTTVDNLVRTRVLVEERNGRSHATILRPGDVHD